MEDDTTLPAAARRDFSPLYVRFGSKAAQAISASRQHVRFSPKADIRELASRCPLCAI